MPESLATKRGRYIAFGVPAQAAEGLTTSYSIRTKLFDETSDFIFRHLSQYRIPKEAAAEIYKSTANTVVSSSTAALGNWGEALVQNDVHLPRELGLIHMYGTRGDISSRQVKEVYEAVLSREGTADKIIEQRGLKQIRDAGAIEKAVEEVLAANAKQVADYKAGKEKAFNSLVGQVMKATKGKANPAQVNEILRRKLGG
jgi:aspartyl-tRNA(Asn)/glutamyl-tRNA(Gln) amidotransferase subunit B